MSAVPNQLWDRRLSVLILPREEIKGRNPSGFIPGAEGDPLELSDLHVSFEVLAEDVPTPNNCRIRVENLSRNTESKIQESYTRVILQAGYWGAPYGVIFAGSIKQFRKGRMDAKTTYLEILAADGDISYNYAHVNQSLAAPSTGVDQRLRVLTDALGQVGGVKPGDIQIPNTGGILPRGKVLFGMARAGLRQVTQDTKSTWSIVHGRVNVTPLDGYLPGEAVVLTAQTGLIGRAEQTENGVQARCLINPRIMVGGLVQLDNASINVTEAAPEFAQSAGQLPYDRWAGLQMFADVAADGLYRVYVVEHRGDTRGLDWYSNLTLLAVDQVNRKVK